MPNGGSDCCANCGFNKAVQEKAKLPQKQTEKFWAPPYCALRNIKIPNPFWTYCDNFRYGQPNSEDKEEITKWIFANGLYEGSYERIPWHGNIEPIVSIKAECIICGRSVLKGIIMFHDGKNLGFCSNRHYIEWWLSVHNDS
jgi:hypothetical protein